MKKIALILFICLLTSINIVYSSLIEVGVPESLKGKINSLVYDNASNIVKFPIEFYNTGSVPYKARIKAEILYDNETVFNGWSKERELMPGDKKVFDIYWYNKSSGAYLVKLKAYFGNEIMEYGKFELRINRNLEPEDIFEIKNFRTYDDYIIFDVQSKEDLNNLIVMPNKYPLGWIFEQKEITNITKDIPKTVVINYYPSLWIPSNASLAIAAGKGKYYTEKTLEMKKNEGLVGLFYYIIDRVRIAFS